MVLKKSRPVILQNVQTRKNVEQHAFISNCTENILEDLLGHIYILTKYTQYSKSKLNTKDSIDKQSHGLDCIYNFHILCIQVFLSFPIAKFYLSTVYDVSATLGELLIRIKL